jgi:hypothetical protein
MYHQLLSTDLSHYIFLSYNSDDDKNTTGAAIQDEKKN